MLRRSQYLFQGDLLKPATWGAVRTVPAIQRCGGLANALRTVGVPALSLAGRAPRQTAKSLSGARELLREFPKKTAFQLRRLTAGAEQSDAGAELA